MSLYDEIGDEAAAMAVEVLTELGTTALYSHSGNEPVSIVVSAGKVITTSEDRAGAVVVAQVRTFTAPKQTGFPPSGGVRPIADCLTYEDAVWRVEETASPRSENDPAGACYIIQTKRERAVKLGAGK